MRDIKAEVLAALQSDDIQEHKRLLLEMLLALDKVDTVNEHRRNRWRDKKRRQRGGQLDMLQDDAVVLGTEGDKGGQGGTTGDIDDVSGHEGTSGDIALPPPPSPSLSSPTPLINPSSPSPPASPAASAAARTTAGRSVVSCLTAERHRTAYATLVAGRTTVSVDYELRLLADGGERPGMGLERAEGWDRVGEALHQLCAAGRPFSARNMRTFLDGLDPPARVDTPGGRSESGDRRGRPRDGSKLDEAISRI